MSQQRQHHQLNEIRQHPVAADDAAAASDAKLAEARAEVARAFAAADAILDGIRMDQPDRFLEQVRQSGGQ